MQPTIILSLCLTLVVIRSRYSCSSEIARTLAIPAPGGAAFRSANSQALGTTCPSKFQKYGIVSCESKRMQQPSDENYVMIRSRQLRTVSVHRTSRAFNSLTLREECIIRGNGMSGSTMWSLLTILDHTHLAFSAMKGVFMDVIS